MSELKQKQKIITKYQIKLTRTGTLGLAWVFLPCGIMVISSDTFKGALPATVGLCLGAGAAFALGVPAVLRPPLENKISSLKLVWRIQKLDGHGIM